MEETTIYASYGLPAHEGEQVWGLMWADDAADADRVTVSLPEGYGFCENETGETLVEGPDGDVELLSQVLCRATATGRPPYLAWPDGTDHGRRVYLTVKAREGFTVPMGD